MKTFVTAVLVLAFLLISTVTISVITTNAVEDMQRHLGEMPKASPDGITASDIKFINAYKEKWENRRNLLSLTVNHGKISDIDLQIAEIEGACAYNDPKGYGNGISRLEKMLEELKDMCSFNLTGIL